MATPTITTTIRLPPALHARLVDLAKRANMSTNAYLIELIYQAMDAKQRIKQ